MDYNGISTHQELFYKGIAHTVRLYLIFVVSKDFCGDLYVSKYSYKI